MLVFTFAIESSCDETSAAVLENEKVLSNVISSQFFHKKYGGIVPELASRAHIENITEIAERAIEQSGISKEHINLVAAAKGPGLIGSLLVGYNYAKGFALAGNIPFLGIDHIESHLFSSFIGEEKIIFPFLSLVVSGGHTILFQVNDYNESKVIGYTHDDAAGEAFDKAAKMLGLEYPGGPLIDKLALEGDPWFHKFPKSSIKGSPFDFSFSGIKTSLLYFLKKEFNGIPDETSLKNIAASFQDAVTGVLVEKTMMAAKNFNISRIAVSGGVSANSDLRKKFIEYTNSGYEIYFPKKIYSTDNAAMIGYNAYLKYRDNGFKTQAEQLTEKAYARFKY